MNIVVKFGVEELFGERMRLRERNYTSSPYWRGYTTKSLEEQHPLQ